MTNFSEFNLKPFLLEAIKDLKFDHPTPVQEKLIPVIMKHRDVVGQSATGSGKTHAFLLPIFNQIDPSVQKVQAVITTPSRELAYQIIEAAKQLAKFSPEPISTGAYVGGTDKVRQEDKLKREQPQLIIGTPGRIWDLIKNGGLDVHTASQLVIDEADMTLDMGFLDVVDHIAASFGKDVQMMVFSATIPQKINVFLKKYMDNPVIEEIPVSTIISPTIDNWLISTKGQDKNQLIYKLLTIGEPYLVLIFANTRKRVEELTDYLKGQGLKVAMIHGGMRPRERKQVMKRVKNLDFQFVVATDLAARGIDIQGVSDVINDDIPTEDLEFFIHRVGRTGRNGMSGTSITLYSPDEEKEVEELEDMGIHFKPKALKHGEIIDSYDRNRRKTHRKHHDRLDPTMIGMIKKKKKKIKPGYKRRIKMTIARKDEMDRRIKKREEARSKRKQRKNSSNRYQ
ncbi:MAG: DEAD/DEAH box helicase [Lentilactobacillus diolivorans]|jgi:ATP-dependent RNA helicase CshB|uniref:DEAD-box ATP-dependent RNA helicase CshB n=2 Tax=Lentilactobacillus diolivorans TaxID=179838 RepID=A0A0R1SQJ7_9LACO|nr:DEAD/DEAH box helicase [Lentilactobacillus diolivorans]RRG04521.1 MAG: DEAD/DEAH box helicase [Lactobacillus sp.]KRL68970.1 DEAD DEAH box helicase [Lentilactobacillus diolivorans DSM 14421]MCH4163459.1 DEAD/DEAH box helicase [Lentilactobacillus diolivorans]MDH5104390.1 DEAD/DEAH box helicase [Lentilactobacillus diolivorans]GEP22583.1 DEAD-box ATP-dependent RNA helicase CshB [Lentilactobacillus diolivorans]